MMLNNNVIDYIRVQYTSFIMRTSNY